MTRKHGGKTWIAPKVLIREDVRGGASCSLNFPHLLPESLISTQHLWQELR
jgi:hypothetical protein